MPHRKLHICIVTQSHLCRNPRVLKEATTLAAVYKITIVTSIFSSYLFEQDRSLIAAYPNITLQIVSDLTQAGRQAFIDRAVRRAAGWMKRTLNINSALTLGYGAGRYYAVCCQLNADLYICHQELAAHIGTKLIQQGYKVGFDLEDWYSEDLLPAAQKERPLQLLRNAEAAALNVASFCYTTSHVLAEKLTAVYGGRRPEVIYNVFSIRPDLLNKPKSFNSPLKLLWFSQTIGPGRGLENFLTLLRHIDTPLELHLLGNITLTYTQHLKELIPQQHQLSFHKLVEEQQLADKIACFDIGLALERDVPPSRNYTITNKFFQYIQAGLPVIATKTEGQQEAFETFCPGLMLSQQASADDVNKLTQWLNDLEQLQTARLSAIAAAGIYNWEKESARLLKIVQSAIEK